VNRWPAIVTSAERAPVTFASTRITMSPGPVPALGSARTHGSASATVQPQPSRVLTRTA
jgi:hypothetical protein